MSPLRTLTPLLAADMDLESYAVAHESGRTPDRYPYGLEHLPDGWALRGLPAHRPAHRWAHRPTRDLLRRALRRVLVADVVSAWRRRREICAADVLYAHSESDYLGAAVVLRLCRASRPVLVGHTIWLCADWERWGRWRRGFLRWAMRRVDLFVYNAEPNKILGERITPSGRHVYIPFGISRSFLVEDGPSRRRPPASVVSVGNDRSRDWAVLAEARRALPAEVRVRLATAETPAGFEPAVVRPTSGLAEICELYAGATCLVVPSAPNAHAGGITTILEGVAAGVPVVATRVGGVESYFDDSELGFVPPGDAAALAARIREVLEDPDAAAARAERAQRRLRTSGYTNDVYWVRVLEAVAALGRDDASPARAEPVTGSDVTAR